MGYLSMHLVLSLEVVISDEDTKDWSDLHGYYGDLSSDQAVIVCSLHSYVVSEEDENNTNRGQVC